MKKFIYNLYVKAFLLAVACCICFGGLADSHYDFGERCKSSIFQTENGD